MDISGCVRPLIIIYARGGWPACRFRGCTTTTSSPRLLGQYPTSISNLGQVGNLHNPLPTCLCGDSNNPSPMFSTSPSDVDIIGSWSADFHLAVEVLSLVQSPSGFLTGTSFSGVPEIIDLDAQSAGRVGTTATPPNGHTHGHVF